MRGDVIIGCHNINETFTVVTENIRNTNNFDKKTFVPYNFDLCFVFLLIIGILIMAMVV